jgi:DNA-binding transcriptional ArsR family regulator
VPGCCMMMLEINHRKALMITIQFSPEDLSNVRFAYSPLVELSLSSYVLSHPKFQTNRRWVEAARQALHGLELPYLRALTMQGGYLPDFLTPTPDRVGMSIEDEIQHMLDTPDDVIRASIELKIEWSGETELLHHFRVYPREMVRCLAEDLRLYWRHAIEPHWSQMSSVLEGDILYRARQLAIEGTPKVFEGLHTRIRYANHTLELDKHRDQSVELNGRGLQLVPTVFTTRQIWSQFSPHYTPMMVYDARGVGQWREETPKRNQALELLIGAGRASVLLSLNPPATTTELAYKLHMTAGAVSQHLDKLSQAELVEPRRSGKRVYYHLTPRGAQLLELFDGRVSSDKVG